MHLRSQQKLVMYAYKNFCFCKQINYAFLNSYFSPIFLIYFYMFLSFLKRLSCSKIALVSSVDRLQSTGNKIRRCLYVSTSVIQCAFLSFSICICHKFSFALFLYLSASLATRLNSLLKRKVSNLIWPRFS